MPSRRLKKLKRFLDALTTKALGRSENAVVGSGGGRNISGGRREDALTTKALGRSENAVVGSGGGRGKMEGGWTRHSIYEILDALPRERELAIYSPVKLPIRYKKLAREILNRGSSRVNILVKIGPGEYMIICRAKDKRDCVEVFTALRDNKYLQAASVRVGASGYSEASMWIGAHNEDVPMRLFLDAVNPSVIYSLGSCNGIKDYKKCIPVQRSNRRP